LEKGKYTFLVQVKNITRNKHQQRKEEKDKNEESKNTIRYSRVMQDNKNENNKK
jgi:hypothetical protein